MQLKDAIKLINHPILQSAKMVWADFGCGAGLFTHALAQVLAPGSKIYAVDRALQTFEEKQTRKEVAIQKIQSDFIDDEIQIDKLDGILMSNSLHFVRDKTRFLKQCDKYFKKHRCFLIVEYDIDQPNAWVPYPISFNTVHGLFKSIGYQKVYKINEVPSKYHRANIYSALMLQEKFI